MKIALAHFKKMVGQFAHEQHLLGQNPHTLFIQNEMGLSSIIVENNMIVGHTTLWTLIDGWFELGTTYVDPMFRGKGMAKELYREVLKLEDKIMLTTTNPIVYHISDFVGMNEVSFWDVDQIVHRATCICPAKKIQGCVDQMRCPLKDRECKLFVK